MKSVEELNNQKELRERIENIENIICAIGNLDGVSIRARSPYIYENIDIRVCDEKKEHYKRLIDAIIFFYQTVLDELTKEYKDKYEK